jgi:GAF domain-containing protein
MDEKRKREHLDDIDRVLTDVREHLEYTHEQGELYELQALQLLLHVTKAMHSQHDIHALLTLILDSALSFAEADRAFLMLFSASGDLRFKMGRSYSGNYLTQDQFMISTSVVQQALESQTPIILTDAQSHAEFAMRESIIELNLRTIMAAPLRFESQTLGLIYVDSKRPLTRYSKHHLNVLTSLADQAAVAITNAQKFETYEG